MHVARVLTEAALANLCGKPGVTVGVVAQFAQPSFDFLQGLTNDSLGRLDVSSEEEGESVELRKSGVWEERGLQDGDSYR